MLTHRRDPRAAALRTLLLVASAPATGLAEPPSAPGTSTARASAPASATVKGPDSATADATTHSRDHEASLGEVGSLSGATGLLHMAHAEASEPGQLRIGVVAEGFSVGFLCTPTYPCPALKAGGAPITSDRMTHAGGTLSLGASIARIGPGILEAHASSGWMSNSDSADRSSTLEVAGDTTLGLKYAARVAPQFHVGAMVEAMLVNGSGSGGFDWGATSARFTGMATFDLRERSSPLPVRVSATLGYTLDNTGVAIAPIEVPTAQGGIGGPITRIERFGLAVNRADHIDAHVGVEAFLVHSRIRPFLEYGASVAFVRGPGQFTCNPANASRDQCLRNDFVVPSVLTLGARFFPWNPSFSVTAAFDIGVTGTNNFIEEVMPVPPWTAYVGAGWALDTVSHPITSRMTTIVEHAPARRNIYGLVHERGKATPIAGAVVNYENHPDLNAQVTTNEGGFVSPDLEEGVFTVWVTANGYKPATCEVAIGHGANVVPLDCALEALPREGVIVGRVRDADTDAALAGITVRWVDAEKRERTTTTDGSGVYRLEKVPAGAGELHAVVEGYLDFETAAEVEAQKERSFDLALHAEPRPAAVKISSSEVIILRPLRFLFARDSAVILPESYDVLTEVANTFIRETRIRKFEVQGHTDDTGSLEHNRLLSGLRAEAVRVWLAEHGVAPERMVAKGYGHDVPLVPNKTPEARATNRRVQFVLLEQEPEPPTK